jgi:hypothetical protein
MTNDQKGLHVYVQRNRDIESMCVILLSSSTYA